ncbi:hypothetical protein EMIT043CA1_30064 [Pseudomonas brassicacearum]
MSDNPQLGQLSVGTNEAEPYYLWALRVGREIERKKLLDV